ncbi:maleylpyruvate isomerase family mycothiol-dependent enzyme [Actinomadura miaoliensis]|uniref:Maleylpyruvate isomerase family mycothiol-dependent enzyme n=1 Tax=Actinomadura miaoliensis TaxID=430685 RepID=A0ABP7WQQ7_9ACTN
MRWDHIRYCDAAQNEMESFAARVRDADLDTPVPTCPGWSLADLVRHLGRVHRWAGGMVERRVQRRVGARELGVVIPDDPAELRPWFEEGAAALLRTLRAADPDEAMWAWGADQHVRFWGRRMLHETAVHRCDADLALGAGTDVPADVADDGITEFAANLRSAAAFSPKIDNLRGDGTVIAFTASDTGTRMLLRLLPDRFAWTRTDRGDDVRADAEISGAAGDLYLFLWGRRRLDDPGIKARGDEALLTLWTENSAV